MDISGKKGTHHMADHGQVLQTPSMQVFPGLHCPFWAGTPLPPMTMCKSELEPPEDEPPLLVDCDGAYEEPPPLLDEYE